MKTAYLNLRTENSLGLAVADTAALLDRAREFRLGAVGRADRNSLVGMEAFLSAARARGLHAVAGVELELAAGTAGIGNGADPDDLAGAAPAPRPLVLFAENGAGLASLARLVSAAHRRGGRIDLGLPGSCALHPHWRTDPGRPFITLEDLERHHEGLIAQSPGLTGDVSVRIQRNEVDAAERLANRLAEIFGRSSLYLGLSGYGRPEQARLNADIAALAGRVGLPVVVSNEIDHLNPEDAAARDLLRALGATAETEASRYGLPSGEASHFRSPAELARLFQAHPEALENAVHLAARCRIEADPGLPRYPLPAGRTEAAYLASLCDSRVAPDHRRQARLDRELAQIAAAGLAGYFLVLWDLVRHARAQEIPVGPGRGAVTASLVAHRLGITGIDPCEHGLEFEHFLAEAEPGPPVFVLDVVPARRLEIAQYLEHRYGRANVARAGRMEVYSPREAVREAGSALGIAPDEVEGVAKKASNEPGADLALVVAHDSRLARQYRQDERVRTWLNLARRLQGLPRQYSPHPSGLVVAAGAQGGIPLQWGKDGRPLAQVSWTGRPERGLIRIDLPGRNDLIAPETSARQVVLFSPRAPRRSSSARTRVLEALARGDVPVPRGMEKLIQSVKPRTLGELARVFSLQHLADSGRDLTERYLRRRSGQEAYELGDAALEAVLGPTEGLLLDQEQIVDVAVSFAGLSRADGEKLRMTIVGADGTSGDGRDFPRGKTAAGISAEDAAQLAGWRLRFISGAARRGVSPERAGEVFLGLVNAGKSAPARSESLVEATILYRQAYEVAGAAPRTRDSGAVSGGLDRVTLVRPARRGRGQQLAMRWPDPPDAAGWNYRHTGTDGPR